MLSWKSVLGLSPGEQDAANKFEAFIDDSIRGQSEADPHRQTFNISRQGVGDHLKANGVDGLTNRVRVHVLDKFEKDGYALSVTDADFLLTVPTRNRGGRPKKSAQDVQTTTQPETVAETPAVVASVG